ncbi:hypothetical protein JOC86_002057 [Bacillus pakistanensis]|uniref:Uncharacterized protein n=1 Tax=Rossellomorea pakistanensis TaxID=992288 RepID=A0ABS2NCC0_9BACI|nr:hypothetical protein [Bacillus pakistanensis]MBM7585515.1 hypothetical protein [Bacillus pakistanensis]
MIAGLNEIYKAKTDLDELKQHHSELNEQLLHVVSLTRQLQIKYGYMGSLLMEEDLLKYRPKFIRESVLSLYQTEIQKLKEHPEISMITDLMKRYRHIGYSKIFLLMLGAKPEAIQGSNIIK